MNISLYKQRPRYQRIDLTMTTDGDLLVTILRQIQQRRTVRPDDATMALLQYNKLLDRIKEMRVEIEYYKAVQTKKPLATVRRTASLSKAALAQHEARKNLKPGVTTPSASANSSPRIEPKPVGTVTGAVRLSRMTDPLLSTQLTKTDSSVITTPRLHMMSSTTNLVQMSSRSSKITDDRDVSVREMSGYEKLQAIKAADRLLDKDREISRLRMENVQMKVSLGYASKQPTTVAASNESRTSGVLDEFRKIYEREYRSARFDLEKHYRMKEEAISELLGAIAREAYTFCSQMAKYQFDEIMRQHARVTDILIQPRYVSPASKDVFHATSKAIIGRDGFLITRKFLKDYRKAMAKVCLSGFGDIFEGIVSREVLAKLATFRTIPKSVRPYINRLLESNWLMILQEPPIAQAWARSGQLLNKEQFNTQGGKTSTVVHTVWPALLFYKDGPVAEKGICFVK